MLSNDFTIQPDRAGDPLEKLAYDILAIDMHAIVPHDLKGARRLLADLQQHRQGTLVPGPASRRYIEMHAIHNANLSRLALAKRLGVRPFNTMPPEIPFGGVSEDTLQAAREFWAQIDIDIGTFESTTPEQRRIMRLEARLVQIEKHNNSLVDALRAHDERIVRLEAIDERIVRLESVIQGPRAA
jgi:hypothetical protein